MIQTNLNNWDIVRNEIERSKIKRINWNNIFGHSLTDEITKHRLNNINSENCYKIIKSKLILCGFEDLEILRKLKINVGSRYAEQETYKKRMDRLR